jgi:hypothetical protein
MRCASFGAMRAALTGSSPASRACSAGQPSFAACASSLARIAAFAPAAHFVKSHRSSGSDQREPGYQREDKRQEVSIECRPDEAGADDGIQKACHDHIRSQCGKVGDPGPERGPNVPYSNPPHFRRRALHPAEFSCDLAEIMPRCSKNARAPR